MAHDADGIDALAPLLGRLLAAAGPSGFEMPAAAVFRDAAGEFAEDVRGDALGNSFAVVNPGGRPRVALVGAPRRDRFLVVARRPAGDAVAVRGRQLARARGGGPARDRADEEGPVPGGGRQPARCTCSPRRSASRRRQSRGCGSTSARATRRTPAAWCGWATPSCWTPPPVELPNGGWPRGRWTTASAPGGARGRAARRRRGRPRGRDRADRQRARGDPRTPARAGGRRVEARPGGGARGDPRLRHPRLSEQARGPARALGSGPSISRGASTSPRASPSG